MKRLGRCGCDARASRGAFRATAHRSREAGLPGEAACLASPVAMSRALSLVSLEADAIPPDPPDPSPGAPGNDSALLDAYSHAVVGVVKSAGPAVVGVQPGERRSDGEFAPNGHGSGVFITPDGYALTNDHVVGEARELRVMLPDGRELRAKLVGRDPATDLALLRAEGSALPFVRLEVAKAVQPGQLAIAIGNPFGFESS